MSMDTKTLTQKNLAPPVAALAALRTRALIVGIVCAALAVVGAFTAPEQFFRGYLMGYMWCLAVALGSMAWIMLGHLTGGNWFMLGRRIMEAATRTLPLMVVLFIPIALGMHKLYIWTDAAVVKGDKVLEAKQVYLNPTFWIVRVVVIFAIWLFWQWRLNVGSARQDTNPEPSVWQGLKAISAPGILIWALTLTFASVDWVMSLDPHWYSTIYGMLYMAQQLLSTLAFTAIMLIWLSRYPPFNELIFKDRLHDFGKLLFALTMVWGYFSFSQFLIIWSGNLPEEITWFVARLHGGWQTIALVLVFGQFVLPFALLLFRDIKRDSGKLAAIAVFILIIRLVDMFWLVAPNPIPGHGYGEPQIAVHWTYIVTPLAIGGIWFAAFLWNLAKRPLLVINEPQLPRLWEESHGH